MRTLLLLVLVLRATFSAAQANRNDVVIDEVMADPVPSQNSGLPGLEYLELKNISMRPHELKGWKIVHATGSASIRDNFILQPDSFVILCASGSREALSVYGPVLPVSSFPSLDNDGEEIALISSEGKCIHAIHYRNSWYRNALKSEGGWSLEMIDPRHACGGASNWEASTNQNGGTPGTTNSVNAVNPDETPPALLHGFARDSLTLILHFDEPLDSASAINAANYAVSEGIGQPLSVTVAGNLSNILHLRTGRSLIKDKVYTLTTNGPRDCAGNSIGSMNTVQLGRASMAAPSDIVINEILFNPKPSGVDYIEIYNRSSHIIDLSTLYVANRSSNATIGTFHPLDTEHRLLFSGGFHVITENAPAVSQQYTNKNPAAFGDPVAMPAFPDDRGTVILLNASGEIIDEVSYAEDWHFRLLDDKRGIALERIDYYKSAQDPANWHSAATDAGHGTPGYQNSQFRAGEQAPGTIAIHPAVFSPDNNGFDDYASIQYNFPEPGYVCNITLFDETGRAVRFLTRNAICGERGSFIWDGLDEKHHALNMGVYIALTEVFNLKGSVRRFKSVVVLARKLN